MKWERANRVDNLELHEASLVTVFGGGLVVVSLKILEGDGDYLMAFTMQVPGATRTLPEVEDFIRRCAQRLIDEPVIPA